MLEDPGENLSLADVRRDEGRIEASSPSGSYGALSFSQMREREKVGAYIDPCSFFMTYGMQGLAVTNIQITGGSKVSVQHTGWTNVYDFLEGKFLSRNTIYMDLRSEMGYSLNYTRDNEGNDGPGTHFKLTVNNTTSPGETNYYQMHWPLYLLEGFTPAPGGNNSLSFSFWRTYNPVPVIYIDFGLDMDRKQRVGANRFFEDTTYDTPYIPSDNVNTDDWSKSLVLYTPVAGSFSISSYVRFYVNRRYVPNGIPATAFKRRHYLDNIFGPVLPIEDLMPIPVSRLNKWAMLPKYGKRYVRYGQIDLIVEVGFGVSANLVAYIAHVVDVHMPGVVNTGEKVNGGAASTASLQKSILNAEYGKTEVFKIEVSYEQENIQLNYSKLLENFEHRIFLLGMGRQEYEQIRNVVSSNFNSNVLNTYIGVVSFDQITFNTNEKCYLYESCVIGIDNNDVYNNALNINPKIFCLTTNGFMFSTSMYNANTDQTIDGAALSEAYIPIEDILDGIRKVETTYIDDLDFDYNNYDEIELFDRDGYVSRYQRITLSVPDSLINTTTRLRVHYYGTSVSYKNKNAFSNFYNQERNLVFDIALEDAVKNESYIGVPRGSIIPGTTRKRKMYALELHDSVSGGYAAYHKLISHASENGLGDNPSPYLKIIKPHTQNTIEFIDLGHLLLGFEGFYYSSPSIQADPVNIDSYLTEGYFYGNMGANTGIGKSFKKYNIYHLYDLCGLIGDIGAGAAEYFYHEIKGTAPSDEPFYPNTPDLEKYFNITSPNADILSDVDAVGLWHAYLVLKHNIGLRLSDVLTLYYTGENQLRSGLTINNSIPNISYYTVKFRWLIFSSYLGFIRRVGTSYEWLPVNSNATPPALWTPVRDAWRLRMFFFVQFWFGKVSSEFSTIPRLLLNPIIGNRGEGQIFAYSLDKWKEEDDLYGYTADNYPNPMGVGVGYMRSIVKDILCEVFEDIFLMGTVKPRLIEECNANVITIN